MTEWGMRSAMEFLNLMPKPWTLAAADDQNRSGTWHQKSFTEAAAAEKWLTEESAAHPDYGFHYRPAPDQKVTLIDDVTPEAVQAQWTYEWIPPTALVETSPDNFQAWHVWPDDTPLAQVEAIADAFHTLGWGDDRAHGLGHAGRLPGSTSRKHAEPFIVRSSPSATGKALTPEQRDFFWHRHHQGPDQAFSIPEEDQKAQRKKRVATNFSHVAHRNPGSTIFRLRHDHPALPADEHPVQVEPSALYAGLKKFVGKEKYAERGIERWIRSARLHGVSPADCVGAIAHYLEEEPDRAPHLTKSLNDFHAQAGIPSESHADVRWAMYAKSRGLSHEKIQNTVEDYRVVNPDLNPHKGEHYGEYVTHYAEVAIADDKVARIGEALARENATHIQSESAAHSR